MTFRTGAFHLVLVLGFLGSSLFPARVLAQNMEAYLTDIEQKTLENNNFREVLHTTERSQLVIMTLQPGEEIGVEVHGDIDQFLRVEAGTGKAVLDGKEYPLQDGSALLIAAGIEHNIINTSSDEPLRLYTVYTPPEHPDQTVHATKAEADAAEHQH
jgi:mannose-6-phosphate isomerase-like protein (cupin superfamily)